MLKSKVRDFSSVCARVRSVTTFLQPVRNTRCVFLTPYFILQRRSARSVTRQWSLKNNEREKAVAKIDELYKQLQTHIGHTVQYSLNSSNKTIGKMIRLSFEPSKRWIEVWVEAKPFPIRIFSDQLIRCVDRHTEGE